jgi:hypothetical protein
MSRKAAKDQCNRNQGQIDLQHIAARMAATAAGVQQAGEQALQARRRDLQSRGIDPSAGRYAALDRASRVQTAAAAVAAANQQAAIMRNQAMSAGPDLKQAEPPQTSVLAEQQAADPLEPPLQPLLHYAHQLGALHLDLLVGQRVAIRVDAGQPPRFEPRSYWKQARLKLEGMDAVVIEPNGETSRAEFYIVPGSRGEIGVRSGWGPDPTPNWQEGVRRKLQAIPPKKRQRLHKARQLRRQIERELAAEGITVSSDAKKILAIIRKFV